MTILLLAFFVLCGLGFYLSNWAKSSVVLAVWWGVLLAISIDKKHFQYFDIPYLDYPVLNVLLVVSWVALALNLTWYLFIKPEKNKKQVLPYISIHRLQEMNWEEFEKLVKKIFELKQYQVERIGGNGADGGVDLVVKRQNGWKKREHSMVQCKRYKNNVGVGIVREMYAVGQHKKFHKVYIYTSADFTKGAREFAKGKNMILVSGVEMIKEIKKLR